MQKTEECGVETIYPAEQKSGSVCICILRDNMCGRCTPILGRLLAVKDVNMNCAVGTVKEIKD